MLDGAFKSIAAQIVTTLAAAGLSGAAFFAIVDYATRGVIV